MASGTLRRFHLEILYRVAARDVTRGLDFEYHLRGRKRHVTEAVYLLESFKLVTLTKAGGVFVTDRGVEYLVKRGYTDAGDTPAAS